MPPSYELTDGHLARADGLLEGPVEEQATMPAAPSLKRKVNSSVCSGRLAGKTAARGGKGVPSRNYRAFWP